MYASLLFRIVYVALEWVLANYVVTFPASRLIARAQSIQDVWMAMAMIQSMIIDLVDLCTDIF